MRIIPLGLYYKPLTLDVLVFVVFWCTVYIVSYCVSSSSALSCQRPSRRLPTPLNNKRMNRAIVFLAGTAFIGGLLLLYEYAIARQYGFSTPVSDIRVLEINAVDAGRKGSIISALARFMMPSLLAAWPLYVVARKNVPRKISFLLFSGTAMVIWVQAMYEGGRFFLTSLLGVALFALICSNGGRLSRNLRKVFLPLLVIASAVVYSALVFLERAGDTASLVGTFEIFAETFDISMTDFGFDILSGPLRYVAFPVYMLLIYVTHPLSELAHILSAHSAFTSFGGYQFPQMIQILSALGFPVSLSSLNDALSRPGVYVTIVGANYIDFSALGVIASSIFYGSATGHALRHYKVDPTSTCAGYGPLLFLCSCFAMVHPLLTTVWPAFLWIFFSRMRLKRFF